MGKGRVKVFIDGSFKDGRAGIGIKVVHGKEVFFEFFRRVDGCRHGFDAERMALIEAMKLFKPETYATNIQIYTDAKNLLHYLEIDERINLEWIPRAENLAHDLSVRGRNNKVVRSKRLQNLRLNSLNIETVRRLTNVE